jgi:erythronate-4-phosphate dehydrogenase
VAQYVFGSIAQIIGRKSLAGLTLGVVGVGHVGSIVERWGRQLGLNLLLCDPPRAAAEGSDAFVDIAEIAEKCDIITFHTPLTKDGDHPTYHILNEELLNRMKRQPLVINSARGGVVDTPALIRAIDNGTVRAVAIDCWEGEPAISLQLLERAVVATPHIAGYSREGKIRATAMAVEAFTCHFKLPAVHPEETVPQGAADVVTIDTIADSYSPAADTVALKQSPADFERLRNNYNYRHETV